MRSSLLSSEDSIKKISASGNHLSAARENSPEKAPTSKIAEGSKPTDLSKAKLSVTVLFTTFAGRAIPLDLKMKMKMKMKMNMEMKIKMKMEMKIKVEMKINKTTIKFQMKNLFNATK